LSSRSGTQTKPNKPQQKRPQQTQQQQAAKQQAARQQQAAKPKLTAAEAQAISAQEAARREARVQRQNQARAQVERRMRTQKLRTYGITGAVVLVVLAIVAYFVLRDFGKPGEAVPIMTDRTHLANATDPHVAYSTDPPTSGPHTQNVPQFKVYTNQADLPVTMQVHGLEDGGVVINYKPDLDKPTVDKLTSLAELYENTPGKGHVILSPYQGLTNAIVLTSWGRIQRFDTYDEPSIRAFIDAYVNIDHHEGTDGTRLP
jgi:Protein of unknown function (DUF3105)